MIVLKEGRNTDLYNKQHTREYIEKKGPHHDGEDGECKLANVVVVALNVWEWWTFGPLIYIRFGFLRAKCTE